MRWIIFGPTSVTRGYFGTPQTGSHFVSHTTRQKHSGKPHAADGNASDRVVAARNFLDQAMILIGDARDLVPTLAAESVQTVITSPPFFRLRDYEIKGQIGLEDNPHNYIKTLVDLFSQVRRVLRNDGTLWLNLGDSFVGGSGGNSRLGLTRAANNSDQGTRPGRRHPKENRGRPPWIPVPAGFKRKDLYGIPWRVALALQADGWILRSDVIWAKGVSFCPTYSGSVMPENVNDRPTRSHEYLFLLSKGPRYFYNADAMREPGSEPRRQRRDPIGGRTGHTIRHSPGGTKANTQTRNLRSVWTINTESFVEAHFATFPMALVEPCVQLTSRKGDTVLDPFAGSGTTGIVAQRYGRKFLGIELRPDYAKLANNGIIGPLFFNRPTTTKPNE